MSKQIHVGAVAVGGGAPVSIQSMCNTPTQDVERTVSQILRLEQAGCQIIRVAVPDMDAARPSAPSAAASTSPWWRISTLTIAWLWSASARGWTRSASTPATSAPRKRSGRGRRLPGPGHPHPHRRQRRLPGAGAAAKIRRRHRPGPGGQRPSHVRLLNDCGFDDICISVKCSHVPVNMAAYRMLHEQTHYPLHLGVTEAGTPRLGVLKSAIGIGGLLCQGIGDTLRVSLTAGPEEEEPAPLWTSCPPPVCGKPAPT